MLSPSQIEQFFKVGFVVLPDVFTPGEVGRMRLAFERLERIAYRLGGSRMYRGSQFVLDKRPSRNGAQRVRIHRIVWCGAAEHRLSEYGQDPRLLRMASQLLGSQEMNQLINQAHFKFPGDGVEFPWHQDSLHRRYGKSEWTDVNGRGSYVQTVMAVDDVTESNGPMQFIPGSCQLGHVDLAEGQLPDALLAEHSVVPATMKAGSVLLFGPYTFHRSLPNNSTRPRRVFINGYAYPGANSRVYPGEGAGRLLHVA